MNILENIAPVVITLDPSSWGKSVIIPATIKAGYAGKVCKFKFRVTLLTQAPADMGEHAGLNSEDGLFG